jgi:hypothetical protein
MGKVKPTGNQNRKVPADVSDEPLWVLKAVIK